MRAVLAGVLASLSVGLCVGCGGEESDGERLAVYHLETAIGPPGNEGELRCGPPRVVCPGILEQPVTRSFRYAVLAEPALTADDVDRSSARRATDPGTGTAGVTVDLTAAGSKAFARLTKEAARAGGRDQGWHHIALIVGDEIVAFPEIDFDVYPDGIENAPGIQIAAASDAEAQELAGRLRGD